MPETDILYFSPSLSIFKTGKLGLIFSRSWDNAHADVMSIVHWIVISAWPAFLRETVQYHHPIEKRWMEEINESTLTAMNQHRQRKLPSNWHLYPPKARRAPSQPITINVFLNVIFPIFWAWTKTYCWLHFVIKTATWQPNTRQPQWSVFVERNWKSCEGFRLLGSTCWFYQFSCYRFYPRLNSFYIIITLLRTQDVRVHYTLTPWQCSERDDGHWWSGGACMRLDFNVYYL